jgi:hypothetical protein
MLFLVETRGHLVDEKAVQLLSKPIWGVGEAAALSRANWDTDIQVDQSF